MARRHESLGEFEQSVLLAVAHLEQGAYGVPIRHEIEKRTGRPVAVGALYTALDRLEKQGLVAISVPSVETNFDLEQLRLPGDKRRAFGVIAHERLGLVVYRRRGWI